MEQIRFSYSNADTKPDYWDNEVGLATLPNRVL